MPSVQVVLCARNSAGTIEKSISSLLLEGISPKDIIVVDGLSEDATWKIASGAGCTVISDSGKGFVAARTMGIERVTSAFTLIIGPDDAMEPGSIQKLVDELRANKKCAAVTARKRVATELDNFLDKGMDFYYSLMPVGVVPVIGNPSLYRTHLLKQNKYDSRFSANEDTDWCTRVRADGWVVVRSQSAQSLEIESLAWPEYKTRWIWYGIGDFRFVSKYWRLERKSALRHLFHPLKNYIVKGFGLLIRGKQWDASLFLILCGTLRYLGFATEAKKAIFRKQVTQATGR